jgi:hypothetical protein
MREIMKDWKGVATNSRWIYRWRFSDEINKGEGLRREFWEEFKRSLRRTPTKRLRRDSLSL